jgi:hypothetical protein
VQPSDVPPEVPPGEPETWNWERHMDGPMPKPGEAGRVRQRENQQRMDAETGGDAAGDDGAMDDGGTADTDEL